MNRRDETPKKTYLAVPVAQGAFMVFGYLENGTYYFYVDESTGGGFLCDNSGVVRYNSGPTLTDQFGEYLKGEISAARYAIEFVDVIASSEFQVGDSVPNWDEYAIVPY